MQIERQHNTLTSILVLLGVAAITVFAYYPGMSAGFYFDDEPNLLEVTALHWNEFSWSNVSGALRDAHLTSRPVANTSMALNHLASGLDPAPYHWTNLLIHLAVGFALFWVITLFQRHHGPGSGNRNIASLAVLLFLVHPLNIQATTYMVQRMTSLATLFVLLGLGSYLSGRYQVDATRRWAWYLLTAICFLLAAGSKEIGLLLVPLLLLYESCFNGTEWLTAYRRSVNQVGYPLVILGGFLLVFLVGWLGLAIAGDHLYWTETMPSRNFSGIERVLTQTRVQFFYLSLLLWPVPWRLSLDHDFVVSQSFLDPITTLLAFAVIAVTLVVAVRSIRTRPNVAFPVLAYLLLHSMEAGPVSLELVYEHRMYLPMTMLALLIGLNLVPTTTKYAVSIYSVLLVAGFLLAVSTYQRNLVWGDMMTFYRDTAQKSPGKFRPQYNLGTQLGERGELTEAKVALERAIRIRPDSSLAHNQLANIYLLTNQPQPAEDHYRLAVEYDSEQQEMLERFIQVAPPYLEEQKQWALRQLGR
jgi:tetratricopeptide (TPR) repeat protein